MNAAAAPDMNLGAADSESRAFIYRRSHVGPGDGGLGA